MNSDLFLKLEGIDGEATDSGHEKQIVVINFSQGTLQDVAVGRGVEVSGRGQFIPFSFTHMLDKASPKLQQYCMSGQNIKTAEFFITRSVAGAKVNVYECKMENVKVAKATVRVNHSEENSTALVVEDVELICAKQTWKVTPIKPDGSKDGAIEASFDQVSNK